MENMEEQSKATAHQRPAKGWERVTPKHPQPRETRETFRRDAPSPGQEILAKYDAELDEPEASDEDSQVICF